MKNTGNNKSSSFYMETITKTAVAFAGFIELDKFRDGVSDTVIADLVVINKHSMHNLSIHCFCENKWEKLRTISSKLTDIVKLKQ